MTPLLSDRVRESAAFLQERGVGQPVAAVLLGSGLSGAIGLDDGLSIPYAEIPGFPDGNVPGHDHRLEFGQVKGRAVLVLRGRVHYYEGASLAEVTFPIRVIRSLEPRWMAILNAAGGINPDYGVGDIVFLSDHINWMGDNALVGPNDDSLGPRFPDMSNAYDAELRRRAESVAEDASIRTHRGVYAAVAGPTYETPAEIRMLRLAGADLVGMSTVPEVIVAVHGGSKVLGMSVVTDLAVTEELEPLSHGMVLGAAEKAAPRAGAILEGLVEGEEE
jgi:purine-nucleoside phosphorylase